MKQKIKGRLYRCGNLKDHCLCPLFNCCIWSFEGSLSSPSLCQVPAWLEAPTGPRHVWGQEPQTPLLVVFPRKCIATMSKHVRSGQCARWVVWAEALSQAWVWTCLGMKSSIREFSMCKDQVGYGKYGDRWGRQAKLGWPEAA